MIKRCLTLVIACFATFLAVTLTLGQDNMQPRLYFVEDVIIKPSETENFHRVIGEFIKYFRENDFSFEVGSYLTNDLHMYFTFPLENAEDVERLFSEFNALAEKVDPTEWSNLMQRQYNAIDSYNYGLYYLRPDLSYFPENPRLSPEESNYLMWEFVYIKPGKEAEMQELCKDWVELYKSKGITEPYTTWVAFIGNELPLYVFVMAAKDAVDFQQANSANMEKLGDAGNALYEKTMKLIKRMEFKNGEAMPDLMYYLEE